MSTLKFCRDNIVFTRAGSPITGPFRDEFYPHLRKPFDAADDITCKRLVLLKASSSMGTVALQCILASRIVSGAGDILFVSQSDEDAALFSKTRGREFIQSIPDAMRLLARDKYSMTQDLWKFRGKFVAICGPGQNNQNAVQTSVVLTDESHLDSFAKGSLAAFEKRAGGKWNRKIIHSSTAADIGKEVTDFFYEGNQGFWNFRCPKCNELSQPLWIEDSGSKYNGERVFDIVGDSVIYVCPHCSASFQDSSRQRYCLTKDGDYVSSNPTAPAQTQSYQWPVWAMHTIAWADMLIEYRAAIEAAKLGNLKLHEDWIKKRLCQPYKAEIPDFGQTKKGAYTSGDVWIVNENKLRVCSFDFQEGHGAEGVHWWGQVDEFCRNGESRRIKFLRLESWADCRAFQQTFNAADSDTYCDAGHRDKEVFAKCSEWRWYALIASDSTHFSHSVTLNGKRMIVPNSYFTQSQPQDSMSGQGAIIARKRGLHVPKGRALPIGWCLSRTWSKPNVGFLLMRLKDGKLQDYGIPQDIVEDYIPQLNSYVEAIDFNKKLGTRERILRQVKEADHAFATSSQCLLGAVIRGFYPIAGIPHDDKSGDVGDDLALATGATEREVDEVAEPLLV